MIIWEDIDQIKKYIRVIYFAGGGAFVQEGHYKLLKFLVDNKCTDIEISYNTNLSYDGKFKNIRLKTFGKIYKSRAWPSIEGLEKSRIW